MRILIALLLLPLFSRCAPPGEEPADVPGSHGELEDFFFAWRAFQAPPVADGVPDYSAGAMAAQREALVGWQEVLASVDTTGWPVAHQVDWYLVWAEMNGLEFEHRITRPWERDPAFYVWFYPSPTDVPEREGPTIHGAIELAYFPQPLSGEDAAAIALRLRRAAPLYAAARVNLTGTGRDFWHTSVGSLREQGTDLEALAEAHPDLARAAREARAASEQFAGWVTEQLPQKSGPSGIGKDAHTWNLKMVHLLPYTWEEEVTLMWRELARAHASLRLEEHRNRELPALERIASAGEYDRLLNEAVSEYMEFLEEEEILPIKPYMEAALRERIGAFRPAEGLRGFFSEITYRDPVVMRTHHYHWFDLAMMRDEPHESRIRQTPLLYNIFDGRAEGMATGMEEMMMHAGLFDERPRARELVFCWPSAPRAVSAGSTSTASR